MVELTPEEVFRKDQALARKIADDILGDAPTMDDAVVVNVSETPDTPEQVPPAAMTETSTEQPAEEIPFGKITLGESTEMVTDIEHDEQREQILDPEGTKIRKGEDLTELTPFPYTPRNDPAYQDVVKKTRRELYATERAAGGLPPEESDLASPMVPLESPDVLPTPTVPATAEPEPIVSSVPEVPTPETKPTDWVMERLFNEIPDGRKFVLYSLTGKTHAEYHREGNKILSVKDGVVTENVLARLNKGWRLYAPKEASPSFELKEGDVWVCSTEADGETITKTITIDSVSDTGLVIIHRQINGEKSKIDDVEIKDLQNELEQERYELSKAKAESAQSASASKKEGIVPSQDLKQENKDLLKGRDPKDYSTVFPGDVWVLCTPKGQLLDKLTVNYTLQQGPDIGEIIQASSTWEKTVNEKIEETPGFYPEGLEWRKKAFEEKLRNEGYVLEVAGEKPKAQPKKSEMIDHQKETDPYSRINGGDVWELRSPTGEKLERVDVGTVFEKKKRGKKEMFVEVEMEYSKTAQISTDKKREQWQNFPLETFRNKLKEKGYVLISRGSGVELDFGGYFDEKELKKEKDLLGLPKNEDEMVHYTAAGGEIGVTYDSVTGLYTITHVDDGSIVSTYSEGNIRRLAELEEWRKVGAEQAEPKLQPEESSKQPEQKSQERSLLLPQGSEELYYRAANGSEFKVRKNPVQEGLYVLVALSILQEREINEAELQDLAQKNTWEQFEKGPDPLVGPLPLEKAIQDAREAVGQARADFVRIEAEYRGKENWLKKIFPALKNRDEINPELRQCLEIYERALTTLQSLEIDKVKMSGISGDKLRQSIAGMIREYDFEEAERIDNVKRELRLGKEKEPFKKRIEQHFRDYVNYFNGDLSSQNRWERAIRGVPAFYMALGHASAESLMSGARTVGVGYNKIVSTKGGKYTMMAAGGAAFGTALIFSGGAAATMAGVMLAAKKAAAGAGVAVAAEGFADYGAKVLRSRRANKRADEFFDKALNERIENRLRYGEAVIHPDSNHDLLERLEKYLKDSVNKEAYDKSIKRERNQLYRKSGAILAGALFGNSSFVGSIFSEAQAAVPGGNGGGMVGVAETIEGNTSERAIPPASAVSAPEGMILNKPEVLSSEAIEVVPGSTDSSASPGLLQERTVSTGDTITKYAVDSGKSMGLEGEEGKRFATLLREKLNEKLAGINPETAKAAGFVPNKDGVLTADFIRAGEKIDLGKILSAEEMKALAEQAKDVPSAPVVPVEVPTSTSSAVLNETARVLQEAGLSSQTTPTSEVVETVAPATPDALAEFGVSKQKVTEYLQTLPQSEQVEVFRTMRGTMRDLFNTPEISIYGNYDVNYDVKEHPELTKASMGRVLEDHKTLSSRAFYMYDRSLNPLHWTQMQELAKFTEGAARVLGKEIAMPLKRESIEEYVLRMTLIAKESNKSFPGLHMVK